MKVLEVLKKHLVVSIFCIFLVFWICLILGLSIKTKPKTEFYIDGKPYYTKTYCDSVEKKYVYEYHYGYSAFRGKFCWHYGGHNVDTCLHETIDTIEIK